MKTLLVADINKNLLGDSTAKALTAARELGSPVAILVAGKDCAAVAKSAAALEGVEKVLLADDTLYEHQLAEPMASLIFSIAKDYSSIDFSATTSAKNIAPRVAA